MSEVFSIMGRHAPKPQEPVREIVDLTETGGTFIREEWE